MNLAIGVASFQQILSVRCATSAKRSLSVHVKASPARRMYMYPVNALKHVFASPEGVCDLSQAEIVSLGNTYPGLGLGMGT